MQIEQLDQFTTTIDGTRNVIAAAKQLPGLRKLVHISTQFTVMPGVTPDPETYLQPYTVYGEAKAKTENDIRAAAFSIRWLIVRPTIIWGPHHPSFRDNIFRHIASRNYLHPVGREKIMRAFGYVTNTAQQILALSLSDAGAAAQHVFYVGDAPIDYDIWADAFARGLTNRKARRVPKLLLTAMGKVGDMFKAIGLPAPIDSGRAFRMSTSRAIDLSPTIARTGHPPVSFDEGVRRTLAWLDR